MSLEAKDIYNANNQILNENGTYSSKNKNGEIIIKKFVNVLDYSLDLIKMREIYESVYRRNSFTFNINDKDYSQSVISVNFNYAYKDFNKVGQDIFVKAGYNLNQLIFDDNVCINSGELIGIILNKTIENPIDVDLLGNYFAVSNNKYIQNKAIKTLLTKAELREYLYLNGFKSDNIDYVRFKRSSGSSRIGKCLFIDKKLYKKFHKWDLCGLNLKEGDEIDLAAFEAYISLPSSSIIDTINLSPKNFLVIDDYESIFKDKVIAVELVDKNLIAKEKKCTIKNSIFDGQSLVDSSIFEEKYKNRGMLLLRNRMFKSAGFNTNIQKWFLDNNISDISQLNGITLAKNIKDIKIITTPSSIKYTKFASLKKWFDTMDETFGIVKYDKPTHYFNGRMVQCHYQLLNTLQLSKDDISDLLAPNLDYISQIKKDDAVLRYRIKYPINNDEHINALNTKNDIIFKLMGMNNKFCQTKLYYDFRKALLKSMINNLRQGHLLINGNYSTLLGNGLEMLKHSIGIFKGESTLRANCICCKNFKDNEVVLGSRSPHINAGNILLTTNQLDKDILQYFNLSKEICYINSINENILQRLNGCDFDADQILLTNNNILIDAARKNYINFKVPTSLVNAKKNKHYYTSKDMSDLDIATSINKIGEIVNLSQYLNSILWSNINTGQTIDENKDLYLDICILAVLSGIEIDRAKKEYDLNSALIIKEIKNKWSIIKDDKLLRPMFFKMIVSENGFEINPKHNYTYFKTSMDYLQEQISSFNLRKNREAKQKVLSFSEIVKTPHRNLLGGSQYMQRDRIIKLIEDIKNDLNKLFFNYDKKSKAEKELIKAESIQLKQLCAKYINDLSMSEATMFLILQSIENIKYKNICTLIFSIIFTTPNKLFFKMIKDDKSIEFLEENNEGNIKLFDYYFIKK